MKIFKPLLMIGLLAFSTSCKKHDNGEVIENDYSGNISHNETGDTMGGDFTGDGDSGTYKFAWENPKEIASLNFDITSSTGSVQIIVEDKKGDVVMDETIMAGSGEDSFSGVTGSGKSGIWVITINLTDFDGDGSFSLHPGS